MQRAVSDPSDEAARHAKYAWALDQVCRETVDLLAHWRPGLISGLQGKSR